MSKYSLKSLYILSLSPRETSSVWSPYRWIQRSFKRSQRQRWKVIARGSLSFSLGEPSLLSVFRFIYSPGRHRARILCFSRWLLWWSHCVHPHRWRKSESVSILQHYQAVSGENPSWKLFKATHLSLLQGDLPLLLTANKDSATSEHPVARPHLMRKGCWEITYSIFNHSLELLAKYTRTKI